MRSSCILFLALLLHWMPVHGQLPVQRDSLKMMVSSMPDDTVKVRELIRLSDDLSYSDMRLAEKFTREALRLSQHLDYTWGLAYSQYRLAQIYIDSDYEITEELILESLEKARDLDDSLLVARIYNTIGTLKDKVKEYESAEDYYNRSLRILIRQEKDSLAAAVYNNLGIIYEEKEQYERSAEFYEKAAVINERLGNHLWLAINYLNIGYSYMQSGDLAIGLTYVERSHDIAYERDFQRILPYIYNNLSYYYRASGDHDRSIEYAQLGETSAKSQMNLEQQRTALIHMKDAYLALADYDRALRSSEDIIAINDSINKYRKLKEIDFMEMRHAYEQEKKQQLMESELLRAEIRRKEMTLVVIITGAGLLLIIFVLLYTLQLGRIRRKNLEQKATLLEKEKLVQQLEFKNKELTTNVMYLIQKNEFIYSISNKLKAVRLDSEGQGSEAVSRIIQELDRSVKEDNWNDFEVRFQEVHVGFYHKLSVLYPDLTPNELRLCAFLKLNMTTKEIAGITYQTPDSIKTARYRLRKKLGIDRDENLTAYLLKI